MPLKNSETEYGTVTKTLHWTIALIVLCLLPVGLFMDDLPLGALKLNVYNLHKSFGITVLTLIICRICWHIVSHRPNAVETLKPWEKTGAAVVHYSLYILLIAMPLTGWLMSSAAGRPVHFFDLFILPDLVAQDKALSKTFRELHGDIGWIIIAVVSLHIAAALKHYFIDKDIVLKRMLPLIAVFTSAFLALFLFATPAAADMQQWNMLHEKSTITFRPKQMGTEFKGTFDTFSATIAFDPDNPAASKAIIGIQIGTAHTGAADRDENLKGKDWFDVAQFPDAKFETTSFRKTGADTYVAEGTLTVRNISLPVTLPFKLSIVQDAGGKTTATADGTVTLDRSKFKIGTGQWADTSIIANEVPIDIHVVAIALKKSK